MGGNAAANADLRRGSELGKISERDSWKSTFPTLPNMKGRLNSSHYSRGKCQCRPSWIGSST